MGSHSVTGRRDQLKLVFSLVTLNGCKAAECSVTSESEVCLDDARRPWSPLSWTRSWTWTYTANYTSSTEEQRSFNTRRPARQRLVSKVPSVNCSCFDMTAELSGSESKLYWLSRSLSPPATLNDSMSAVMSIAATSDLSMLRVLCVHCFCQAVNTRFCTLCLYHLTLYHLTVL